MPKALSPTLYIPRSRLTTDLQLMAQSPLYGSFEAFSCPDFASRSFCFRLYFRAAREILLARNKSGCRTAIDVLGVFRCRTPSVHARPCFAKRADLQPRLLRHAAYV